MDGGVWERFDDTVFESSKHHDNKLATSAAVLTNSKVTFPPNIVCLSLAYRAVTLVML